MPKKKKPIKNEPTEKPVVPESVENAAEKQQEIVQFIDKLIKKSGKIAEAKDKERTSNYQNLIAINSEWLDSFFLIGYNLDGQEVVISKASNPKDYNSILLLLKKAFVNLFMKTE